ncbi:carbohydrate binding domain-containing protein [Anaerocolumna sp.]|uniref:carbohydrate binding domain-containing protein n=1 Tax=Anaerocolumna sp. TaxID=2041569 RepID=UPI0028AB3F63|nr:Ig-like domain-containing protein [Anaerocolumna sp.]
MDNRNVKIRLSVLLICTLIINLFSGALPFSIHALADSAQTSTNLINNGSFETAVSGSANGWTDWQASGWKVWKAQGTCTVTMDSTTYHEGSKALKISSSDPTGKWPVIQYGVPVTGGKTYKLSGWIKTEDITNTVYYRIYFTSGGKEISGSLIDFGKLTGTNEWTYVEKTFTVVAGANGCNIYNYFLNNTGTAWFDGLVLEETNNLLTNGGYELVTAGSANGWSDYQAAEWNVWNAQGISETTVDSTVYKEGAKSLRISSTGESARTTVGQRNIPVEPGKYYKLSQWIKTEDISKGASTRIQLYDSSNSQVQLIYTDSLSGTKDWTRVEKVIQASEKAVKCQIENYYDFGTGIAWYDSIEFKEVIPATGVSLDKSEAYIGIGEILILNADITPSNATEKNLIWYSSNTDVAMVADGVVEGLGTGVAIITAAVDGNVKASCIVIVNGQESDITTTNYTVSTDEDIPVRGVIEAVDDTNHPLTYTRLTNPSNGLLQLKDDGSWTYTPIKDYSGTDSFIILIENGQGSIATSSVTININPVNDAPSSGEITAGVVQGAYTTGKITATDVDMDSITYAMGTQPLKGTTDLTPTGNYTYTANPDSTGEDYFEITASDNKGGISLYRVNLFVVPKGEKIIAALKETSEEKEHPRIYTGKEAFDNLKNWLENNDEYITKWFNNVKLAADTLLIKPPKEYELPDGLRLAASTEVLNRTKILAMTYLMTEDSKYAERLWMELDKAGNFKDWNASQHFLDTAEMTNAFGIAYDWLYDYWSPEQKSFIVSAIKEKGLLPGVNAYSKGESWTRTQNNWNAVCNGGLAVGALAVGDEGDRDPEIESIAATVLENAVKGLPYMLKEYKPDGAWYEGPGYWNYGTGYTVYMLSSMLQALGTDYGLSNLPGIDITTDFPIYNIGAKGSYNFADSGTDTAKSPIWLWFGTRFNNPSYYWAHRVAAVDGDPLSMIWYPGTEEYTTGEAPLKLDTKFSNAEVGIMRSGWNNSNGNFLGFKGGYNQFTHGDLDQGSFVYDAYGVRWAVDLGADNYNAPKYWDYSESGGRWTYYRKRAEGHNTFVINPGNYPDQNVFARAKIERFEVNSDETAAMSIVDLTETYNKDAFSAKRGLSLTNSKTELLVQDEISNKEPSDYWWFMHTDSGIEISSDGKSAILSKNGKRLYIQILGEEGSFTVMDAISLPTSPEAVQQPNPGIKKLAVHLENVLNVKFAVRMVPLTNIDEIPSDKPEIVDLDGWNVKEENNLFAEGLSVAGTELQNFHKFSRSYEITLPYETVSVPEVEAIISNSDINVDIELPEALPGIAKITLTLKSDASRKNSYYIQLLLKEKDKDIIASAAQEGNWPENSMDGDLVTRWAAEGDQWIQYYIGEEQEVEAISVAFFKGNERKYLFDVLISEDGKNWEAVLSGVQTLGDTSDLVKYDFPEMKRARYVRIFGHGSNANNWNNVAETVIHSSQIAKLKD